MYINACRMDREAEIFNLWQSVYPIQKVSSAETKLERSKF